jgi:hypothetical protein
MDHRRSGCVATRCCLADLCRLLRDDRAVAILLHAAVQGDSNDELVAVEHATLRIETFAAI